MTKGPRPPRFAASLVRWLASAEDREYALGDLAEGFRSEAAVQGPFRARLWYWGQVLRSIGPLLTSRRWGWEGGMMTGFFKDVQSGLRQFYRAPGFSLVVVATIAIGVGGATAVFSVLRGVVFTPLAFEDSERVVTLWGSRPDQARVPLTVGDYNELHAVDAFSDVSGEWGNTALILGEGNAEQVRVGWVTARYFDQLRIRPQLGTLFGANDENALLLSHDLWERRYGRDPDVIGRIIDLGGNPMEVVGVLPQNKDPNLTSYSGGLGTHQVWRLMPAGWTQGDDRTVGWIRASARLKEAVTIAQAQAELDALMDRVNATVTDRDGGKDLRINPVPVRQDLVGGLARTLWILLGAVSGVLLIAATNVANLMLARAQQRGGEVAIRYALGGGRTRLVRQSLTESLTLALAGGLAGIAVAWAGMRALVAWAPPTMPRVEEVGLDPAVLGFAVAATGVAALFFGVVPALRATRTGLASALSDRTGTASRREQTLSGILVVAEVALSLGLLMGTGLLLRSLDSLNRVDLGFEKEGVLTFALEVPVLGDTPEEGAALINDYLSRVEATPGVRSAGLSNRIPLGGGLFTGSYRSNEMIAAESEGYQASYRFITPGYLEAMGARLMEGQVLTAADPEDVAVIDEQVAELLWPGQNALGKQVELDVMGGDTVLAEVIGVVAPMKHAGVADPAPETIFLSMMPRANQQNFRYMAVRVQGEPLQYVEPIRSSLKLVHGDAVMARIRPMSEMFDRSVASTRFVSLLLTVFGGVALMLATVGLHGLMALGVRRRAREFGIRVALGAEHQRILRGVLGSGARLVLLGAAVGIAISLIVGRFLGSLLYGIEPSDLTTMAVATSVLVAVGLLGAYLPARRVLSVDPVKALRED